MRIIYLFGILFLAFAFSSCTGPDTPMLAANPASVPTASTVLLRNADSIRSIHVMVALCDNKYQGIVPVPAAIGNGQQPSTNLYWGAGYGIKTFFSRSKEWKLVQTQKNPAENILERLLFRHQTGNTYLLADAYDGKAIQQTTIDFLSAAAGQQSTSIQDGAKTLHFGGASNLLAYIGHDGLMDFELKDRYVKANEAWRETIILACYSQRFFSPHLKATGASPLLWSTGLMAPEAYVLHDAVANWVKQGSPENTRLAAAKAYSVYQHCSLKAAQRLLVTGW